MRKLILLASLVSAMVVVATAFSADSRHAGPTASNISSFPNKTWGYTGGDLSNTRYSTLTQITKANVKNLKRVWSTPYNPEFRTGSVQSAPSVVGGRIFTTSSRGTPAAISAATGKLLWNSDPSIRAGSLGNARGVAIGQGMIFSGQADGTLTAFNADTGQVVWKTLINTSSVPTYSPATPMYWNGTVYTSLSGNDLGKLRGAIFAYDAKTGSLKWTFYIVPFAGQKGSETWGDKKELDTGGGGNWTYGAIDPKLGILYEPTGNPSPDFGRTIGNNLYTDSVIALDLKTGKLKWYFQAVHHDQWDYDCAAPPVLWDRVHKGKLVKGLTLVCKSGYVYHLNRVTGKAAPGTPIVETPPPNAKTIDAQTARETASWAKTQPIPAGDRITPHCATAAMVPGPAPDGKPYEYSCTFAYHGTDHYVAHGVSFGGAVNYPPLAYNAKEKLVYVCSSVTMESQKQDPTAPSPLGAIAPGLAGQKFGSNGGYSGGLVDSTKHQLQGTFTAMSVVNNKKAWQKQFFSDVGYNCRSGASTTVTGLVFLGDVAGVIHAYDAKNGKELWQYTAPEGMIINAPPAIYMAGGKQYVAFNVNLGGKTGTQQVGASSIIAFAL